MREAKSSVLWAVVAFVALVLQLAAGCSRPDGAGSIREGEITPANSSASKQSAATDADADSWQRLIDGNKRFAAGKSAFPDLEASRRAELVKAQNPFAVVLSCSDSRVPPEIIFDQGLGDLFTVRVAGNVFDDVVDGSIEYAVEHLGTKLIVVMGHESCGAVRAAIENSDEAHIKTLAEAIKPAVERAKNKPGDPAANVMRENVRLVVEQIRTNKPILERRIAEEKVRVVGAYYELQSGTVVLLPQ